MATMARLGGVGVWTPSITRTRIRCGDYMRTDTVHPARVSLQQVAPD